MTECWDLQELKRLVREDCWGYLNEPADANHQGRAAKTCENLEWDEADVADFLCGILATDFIRTAPLCRVHEPVGLGYVDADMYQVYWDEQNRKSVGKHGKYDVVLFAKLALVRDADGHFCGLVSFHTSGM